MIYTDGEISNIEWKNYGGTCVSFRSDDLRRTFISLVMMGSRRANVHGKKGSDIISGVEYISDGCLGVVAYLDNQLY